MKRIASLRRKARKTDNEAGFTLTELVAGLLVASMLIVGLADITRRYALTTLRAKDTMSEIRTARVVNGLMSELDRIDPSSLDLTPDGLTARVGSAEITARLSSKPDGSRELQWSSPGATRVLRLPREARFELTGFGAIVLVATPGEPPLGIAMPYRTVPFDCQFDTVSRTCR